MKSGKQADYGEKGALKQKTKKRKGASQTDK